METLGKLVELAAVALAAGFGNVFKIYRAAGIARAEYADMGLLFLRGRRVAAVTLVARDAVLLMDRPDPTVGFHPEEAAGWKFGMAFNAGILLPLISGGTAGESENQYSAQYQRADDQDTIKF
jgi:hypothetical protein